VDPARKADPLSPQEARARVASLESGRDAAQAVPCFHPMTFSEMLDAGWSACRSEWSSFAALACFGCTPLAAAVACLYWRAAEGASSAELLVLSALVCSGYLMRHVARAAGIRKAIGYFHGSGASLKACVRGAIVSVAPEICVASIGDIASWIFAASLLVTVRGAFVESAWAFAGILCMLASMLLAAMVSGADAAPAFAASGGIAPGAALRRSREVTLRLSLRPAHIRAAMLIAWSLTLTNILLLAQIAVRSWGWLAMRDVSYWELMLSPSHEFFLVLAMCMAFVLTEPLRWTVSAAVSLDARIRLEGLDIERAIEAVEAEASAGRRKRTGGVFRACAAVATAGFLAAPFGECAEAEMTLDEYRAAVAEVREATLRAAEAIEAEEEIEEAGEDGEAEEGEEAEEAEEEAEDENGEEVEALQEGLIAEAIGRARTLGSVKVSLPSGRTLRLDGGWIAAAIEEASSSEYGDRADALRAVAIALELVEADAERAALSESAGGSSGEEIRRSLAEVLSRPEFVRHARHANAPAPDESPSQAADRSWLLDAASELLERIWKWLYGLLTSSNPSPPPKPAEPPDMSSLWETLKSGGLMMLVLIGTCAALLLALAAMGIHRRLARRAVRTRAGAGKAAKPAGAADFADAMAMDAPEWQREARRLMSEGKTAEAVRALYLSLLVILHRARWIEYARHRTNLEYLLRFRGPQPVRDVFARLTEMFDRAVYGGWRPAGEEYAAFEADVVKIVAAAPGERR
jgi:hypothetical protein